MGIVSEVGSVLQGVFVVVAPVVVVVAPVVVVVVVDDECVEGRAEKSSTRLSITDGSE